ncbi:MAG: class I SAM-dependent methyltransferase [Candidatus Aureabacteria bacterium]|nr:class I SAM-dependent methyltransferase [Candidatus Auribacterota bacterium]
MQACGEVNGKRVLDVGCGSGRYAIALARRGARVTGVDSAAAMIAMAGRIAGESGVADRCLFKAGEFLSLPAERGYDIILAIGLFDYIADPAPYLARMREGGEILVATFPRAWTWRAPVRKLRLALAGCPVHFYTRRRVYRLFRENGWHRVELSRIGKLHFVVAVAPGGR